MTLAQPYWRFRNDNYGLNVDNGWLAAINTAPSSLDMGQQFRLRIEVAETAGTSTTDGFKLQVKVNAGSWNDCGTQSNGSNTAVIVTNSYQYADQDATTNLLSGSSETFEAGEGLYDDNLTASHTLQNEHTEFEWALLTLKNYYDFAVLADGDTIYLRVVRDDGTALDSYQDISYTVNEPAGFIGGTFVESAHSLGPIQDSNGNLYFFGEHNSQNNPTNNNEPCMWKSTDDGVTWDEVDGTNRPVGSDFESADMQVINDIIYIAQHRGSAGIRLHVFNMSAASSNQDTWTTTDEVVDSSTPEADQAVALAVLSDGDMWCFYRTTVSSYESIVYKRRTSGSWGSRNTLDTQATTNFTWVACVVGESNLTHVFYQEITNGTGNIWHRSLSSGGTLSGRESISTASGTNNNNSKGIAKPLYWDDAGDEIIFVVYRESDNDAWSRTITNDGTPSSATGPINTYSMDRSLGGSAQAAMQLVGDGTGNAWLIYLDNVNQHPYLLEYVYGTGWGSEITLSSTLTANFQQIGHYTISNGDEVVGYVLETHPYWDTAGAYGDDGLMWYYSYVLVPGGIASLSGTGSLSAIGSVIAGFATVTGAAALTGTGTLSATGLQIQPRQPVLLDTVTSEANGVSLTSATITPQPNSLLIVVVTNAHGSSPIGWSTCSDTLTGTGSWTRNADIDDNQSNNYGIAVWTAQCGATPGSGTVTPTWTNSTSNRKVMFVFEVPFGFDTTTPIRQTKTGSNATATPSLTFDNTPLASSTVFGAIGSKSDPDSVITPGTGFTEVAEDVSGVSSPTNTGQAEYDLTPVDGVVDWSGAGTLNNVFLAIEIQEAADEVGAAALTGTGTLSGAGIGIAPSAVAMTGTGTLNAIGKQLLWPFSDDFTGSNDDPWAAGKWTTGASP